MVVHKASLPRLEVRNRRPSPLWVGASCCELAGWEGRDPGHADRLRLRNHPQQTDRHREDDRSGRHHAGPGDPWAFSAGHIWNFGLAGEEVAATGNTLLMRYVSRARCGLNSAAVN